jgi:tetratricopeptide (TPR) repeat protein
VGRFSLDVAAHVCTDETLDQWDAIDALATLVERSLVVADAGEPVRYRLLETPRLYALEQLASASETDATRARHAAALRLRFEQADHCLDRGAMSVDAWRQSLANEIDDGVAAWRWAVDNGAPENALSLTACLDLVMLNAPRPQRQALWHTTLPTIDDERVDERVRERWLRGLVCFGPPYTNDLHWLARLQAAADAQAARGDHAQACISLYYRHFGWMMPTGQSGEERLSQANDAIAYMRAVERPDWPPVLRYFRLRGEGDVCRLQGQHAAEIDWYRRAAEMAEQAGDTRTAYSARVALIDSDIAAGMNEQALADSATAIAALRSSPYQVLLVYALQNRAVALAFLGRLGEVRAIAREEWANVERFDMVHFWTDVLALLLALEGRATAAARLLATGLAQARGAPPARHINEERCAAKAEQIVREQLGDETTEALLRSGAALSPAQVLALVLDGSARDA